MRIMKHFSIILLAASAMLALSGCGDFLDEHTSSRGYVRSLDDINELILGEGYLESAYLPASAANFQGSTVNRALPGWIHVMDDDSEVNNNSAATNLWVNAYGPIHAWQEIPFMQPTTGIEVADPTWSNLYERIGSMNAILVELDEKFTGQEGFERTRGEVLFLRAFYYFYLVNFYALPYDKANDGADPGIPLKTSGKVDDKNYDRGTVKMVYDLMIDDLGEAVTLLEGATYYYDAAGMPRKTIYRPSQDAARHLLARIFLYCGRYGECIEQCEEILKGDYSLIDFTTIGAREGKLTADAPEIIFSNGDYRIKNIFFSGSQEAAEITSNPGRGVSQSATFRASPNLIGIYDRQNDKRFEYFDYQQCGYAGKEGLRGYYPTFKMLRAGGLLADAGTFRLAEVYLNMAEACALKGGADGDARAKINELRAKRFVAGSDYLLPSSLSGDALIDFVRNERRRELCFEGHRWFDLRRYAVCSVRKFEKEIHHAYQDSPSRNGVNEGYYILPKLSESKEQGNWVMPIPAGEIMINHGVLKQNVRITPVKHEGVDGYEN